MEKLQIAIVTCITIGLLQILVASVENEKVALILPFLMAIGNILVMLGVILL